MDVTSQMGVRDGPGEVAEAAPGLEGFLLSASLFNIGRTMTGLLFQGRLADGRRFRWEVRQPRLCFFVDRATPSPPGPHARKPLPLRTLRGHPVDALYFPGAPDLARARRHYQGLGLLTYEADIGATARHLMERGIRGSVRFPHPPAGEEDGMVRFVDPRVLPSEHTPSLRLLSLDVECAPGEGLYSISVYGEGDAGAPPYARVFVRDPSRPAGSVADGYEAWPDERGVLQAFFAAVREFDPDVLIGWNVINFDLRYLSRRCARAGMTLDLGTDGPAELVEPEGAGGRFGPQWLARVPGRAVLDGIAMLRAAFIEVDGYSLAAVSHRVLGERKLIELEGEEKLAEITRRFREDKPALARYNLEDSRLAHAIFRKLGLAELAVRKARLTGLAVDRMGGSIAALDFLYLPRLHRLGFVADTESPYAGGEGVPGGLVLDSEPGFFRNVIVLDFKSLYPSIIRTFQVDPLAAAAAEPGWPDGGPAPGPSLAAGGRTLVKGPAGPAFVKELAILPGIVESLMEERERAKRGKDASLSQAVKIIMNSFYGVLGNTTCRFHHPDLAGAITRTGQWILLESRAFLEREGFRVIYGDTDSLFVHAGEAAAVGTEAGPGTASTPGAGAGERSAGGRPKDGSTGAGSVGDGAASLPGAGDKERSAAAESGPAGRAAAVETLRRTGADLSARLNRYLQETLRERYGVESRLAVEFDKIFLRFFLPALRREDRGSKKRYAGLLVVGAGAKGTDAKAVGAGKGGVDAEAGPATALHFTGLESARSDWTALAKEFQADLIGRVFAHEGGDGDLAGLELAVRGWHRRLFAGELDDKLEYRKSLSKDPEEYGASAPPHVRAARALDRRDGRVIRYVMTVDGPEPSQKRSGARPDYRHYAEKQLAPIADMVLRFLGADYASLTDEARQMSILL